MSRINAIDLIVAGILIGLYLGRSKLLRDNNEVIVITVIGIVLYSVSEFVVIIPLLILSVFAALCKPVEVMVRNTKVRWKIYSYGFVFWVILAPGVVWLIYKALSWYINYLQKFNSSMECI